MRGKHPVVVARVAEPGTATEPERIGALGVEPRDRKESDQASCWSSGPRGFKSHPGRLHNNQRVTFHYRVRFLINTDSVHISMRFARKLLNDCNWEWWRQDSHGDD